MNAAEAAHFRSLPPGQRRAIAAKAGALRNDYEESLRIAMRHEAAFCKARGTRELLDAGILEMVVQS